MDPLEELDEDLVEPEVLLELDSDLVDPPSLVEVSRFTEVVRPVLSVVLIVVRVAPLLFTRVSTVVLGVRVEVDFVLVAVVLLDLVELVVAVFVLVAGFSSFFSTSLATTFRS